MATPSRPDDRNDSGQKIIWLSALVLFGFLLWSALTEIDEVTRGDGRVIPALKTQVAQSSEAAVVSEILVRLGQRVAKGDLLMRLDKTPTSVNVGEVEAKMRALTAQIRRLELELEGQFDGAFPCPDFVKARAPEVCDNEERLRRARSESLGSRLSVAENKAMQRKSELAEALANEVRLQEAVSLARQELDLIRPLAEKEVLARVELIRARRAFTEANGHLKAIAETIAKLRSGERESELLVEEQRLVFRQEVLRELTEKRAELSVIEETSRGANERLRRADIRSPVDGIVNEVIINSQGAFVSPGERLVSIVPVHDTLLVETRISPSDIAFIHPGQKALVKVTAFDFSIFGGLEGRVESLGADTLLDPVSKAPYYTVIVRTPTTTLTSAKGNFEIMPGMVCNVDILTGRKTVLSYLLKPINRAREEALRER